MIIAACAYPVGWLDSWDAFAAKLEQWVGCAEADLLVFPEYAAMELASLGGAEIAGDLGKSLRFVSDLLPQIDALHQDLAARYGCHILAGSAPCVTEAGPVNRARLFAPGGMVGVQDKRIMTRFERESWGVGSGGPLRLFETALGRIGILICYDVEFPLLARQLAEAGAEIILAPSCTDSMAGYHRVRIGAQARALENQCVTVQAPLVGTAPWSPAIDENTGCAGIFGPPDIGFPADGVLAQGALDAPGWVRREVDLRLVDTARREGQVLNLQHWPEQMPEQTPPPIPVMDLR